MAIALDNIGFGVQPEVVANLQYVAKVQCNNAIHLGSSCNPYDQPCLFNVVDDPCEMNNLANEKREIVQEMLERLHSYNETAQDIIDMSEHPEAAPQNWRYIWTNWKDFLN